MPLFRNSFFKSDHQGVEDEYAKGVSYLKNGDMSGASRHFVQAMAGGHTSATYNLYLMWGTGAVSPYDFDAAADCWYKAAALGHPKAKESLWLIEAADRGGFGTEILADFAEKQGSQNGLVAPVMICAARFFDVLCRKYGATTDVIAYELDGAAQSDWNCIQSFIQRTGLDKSFYDGGLDRILEGSAADQITDGLNQLSVAMHNAGFDGKTVAMARCSIVGYIILKSPYGNKAQPLLGTDRFFGEEEEADGLELHPLLQNFQSFVEDPKTAEWFGRVAYGWEMGLPADVGFAVNDAMKVAKMISMISGITITDLADAAETGDYHEINVKLNA
jgi:TPR repeat protein